MFQTCRIIDLVHHIVVSESKTSSYHTNECCMHYRLFVHKLRNVHQVESLNFTIKNPEYNIVQTTTSAPSLVHVVSTNMPFYHRLRKTKSAPLDPFPSLIFSST